MQRPERDLREMFFLQQHEVSVARHWSLWGYLLGYHVLKKRLKEENRETENIGDSSLGASS